MKDYNLSIIDYRGGSALVVDSFDLMQMKALNYREQLNLKELFKEVSEKVDYILLLTSYPASMIDPLFKEFFSHLNRINCYRFLTEKGKETIKNYTNNRVEELRKELKKLEVDLNES